VISREIYCVTSKSIYSRKYVQKYWEIYLSKVTRYGTYTSLPNNTGIVVVFLQDLDMVIGIDSQNEIFSY